MKGLFINISDCVATVEEGRRSQFMVITGASKGIGLAAARAFAAEGCTLHLAARSADLLAQAKGVSA